MSATTAWCSTEQGQWQTVCDERAYDSALLVPVLQESLQCG